MCNLAVYPVPQQGTVSSRPCWSPGPTTDPSWLIYNNTMILSETHEIIYSAIAMLRQFENHWGTLTMLLSEVKSKSNLLSLDACWLVCKKSLSYIHSFLPKLILLLLCGNNLRNVIFVAFVCCRQAGALLQKCGAITYLNLLATILVIFSDSCDF